MNHHADRPLPEELAARVAAVAYGDATPADRIRVLRAARRDPAVRRLLQEHRRIARAVRDIPPHQAPPAVAKRVRQEIPDRLEDRVPPRRSPYVWSAVAVSAAACAILLGLMSLRPAPAPEPQYTRAEIEEARLQIEAAFALINRGVSKAGSAVHHDVLAPVVARPIRSGSAVLYELFGKEK